MKAKRATHHVCEACNVHTKRCTANVTVFSKGRQRSLSSLLPAYQSNAVAPGSNNVSAGAARITGCFGARAPAVLTTHDGHMPGVSSNRRQINAQAARLTPICKTLALLRLHHQCTAINVLHSWLAAAAVGAARDTQATLAVAHPAAPSCSAGAARVAGQRPGASLLRRGSLRCRAAACRGEAGSMGQTGAVCAI